jgi:effector-binding domain-containing protein
MTPTNRPIRLLSTALLALIALPLADAGAVEEARFARVLQDGDVEIRDYEPQIVAETRVSGSMKDAGNTAFRPLFRYIDGDNEAQAEIAMTAPVAQREGEKIAMTAPVAQRADQDEWVVNFMMPAQYTMDTIPRPTDSRVSLRQIPAHRMAVIRYSGRWTERNYEEQLQRLRAWLDENGLEATGEPVWARYNAPFSLPFMRRNEILIPLAEGALPDPD